MLSTSEGINPGQKSQSLQPARYKGELKSFIQVMQSNSDFISSSAKRFGPLRKFRYEKKFCWINKKHLMNS